MLYRLVSPMRRKGSQNIQFVQRIPSDVKVRAAGMKLSVPIGPDFIPYTISAHSDAVRISLRSSDASVVKTRQAQVAAYVESVWRSLRGTAPVSLTHRQATALAGELYRAWASDRRDSNAMAIELGADGKWVRVDPRDTLNSGAAWEAALGHLARLEEAEDLEPTFGPLLNRLLLNKGIGSIDAGSRTMALTALLEALRDAFANRKRNAERDYSPDPRALMFPSWEAPKQDVSAEELESTASVSLTGLVEDWWTEAKGAGRTLSTYESYRNTMRRFVAFVQHDNAAAVTDQDVVKFKTHRLSEGVSPKTVGDSDVAGLRSIFAWAVGNRILTTNPAKDIRVTRTKVTRVRSKDFTPEEAVAVLQHSLSYRRGQEKPKTFAAKRWVPLLCAYTGARVGEMVQLRRQDIRQQGDIWVLTITPEAGTVKDKERRDVVLHRHLIELGFIAFVQASREGYLFLTPNPHGETRGVWRSVKNRLSEFVREVVKDKAVAPNHAWRHLFKTVGREAGIADTVLDAICGHSASTVGASYGGVSLNTQVEAFAKFPRFEIGDEWV